MQWVPLIMLGLDAIERTIRLVTSLKEKAKQLAELTPTQEAAIDAREREVYGQAHWQIDPDPDNQGGGNN
jgi:hypothetical protein